MEDVLNNPTEFKDEIPPTRKYLHSQEGEYKFSPSSRTSDVVMYGLWPAVFAVGGTYIGNATLAKGVPQTEIKVLRLQPLPFMEFLKSFNKKGAKMLTGKQLMYLTKGSSHV
jgi:hypothetical protein